MNADFTGCGMIHTVIRTRQVILSESNLIESITGGTIGIDCECCEYVIIGRVCLIGRSPIPRTRVPGPPFHAKRWL